MHITRQSSFLGLVDVWYVAHAQFGWLSAVPAPASCCMRGRGMQQRTKHVSKFAFAFRTPPPPCPLSLPTLQLLKIHASGWELCPSQPPSVLLALQPHLVDKSGLIPCLESQPSPIQISVTAGMANAFGVFCGKAKMKYIILSKEVEVEVEEEEAKGEWEWDRKKAAKKLVFCCWVAYLLLGRERERMGQPTHVCVCVWYVWFAHGVDFGFLLLLFSSFLIQYRREAFPSSFSSDRTLGKPLGKVGQLFSVIRF